MSNFDISIPFTGNDQAGSATDSANIPTFTSMLGAALFWDCAGFEVLQLLEGTKRPAGPWSRRTRKPHTKASLRALFAPPSRYGLGAVVGDNVVVLDADTPAAVARLYAAEDATGIRPGLVIRTSRGEHHYFARPSGLLLSSRCFSTAAYPESIDLLTGEHVVELPPSGGKQAISTGGRPFVKIQDLPPITLELLAKLSPECRSQGIAEVCDDIDGPTEITAATIAQIQACLNCLDPDLPYPSWFRVGAAVFNATKGMRDGYALFDQWSSHGSKYKGAADTGNLWGGLRLDHPCPITFWTLRYLVTAAGYDWSEVCGQIEADFDLVDGEAA